MKDSNTPKVFISYSWDSDRHMVWVRYLAEQLQVNGVNVRLDQWYVKAGDSFTKFMEDEVETADFVMIVCTPEYAKKSNARLGAVGYEQQIISGQLISGVPRSKFIPILHSGNSEAGPNCAIPTLFAGISTIDFRSDTDFQKNLDKLLRVVFSRPEFGPPPLGPAPSLRTTRQTTLSSESAQSQSTSSSHVKGGVRISNREVKPKNSNIMKTQKYLRECLVESFANTGEIFDFCQDHLAELLSQWPDNADIRRLVRNIIAYCQAREQLDILYDFLAKKRPQKYASYYQAYGQEFDCKNRLR